MKELSFGMKTVLALAALAAGSAMYAQGGKAVTSHDGSCQVTVPADWNVTEAFGMAESPDKTMSAVTSSPKLTPMLSGLKQNAPTIYTNDKITKDTPTVFQMEGESMNGKPNVYRGIQIAGKVCIVEVQYSSGTIDDARKIAESLKSAK